MPRLNYPADADPVAIAERDRDEELLDELESIAEELHPSNKGLGTSTTSDAILDIVAELRVRLGITS